MCTRIRPSTHVISHSDYGEENDFETNNTSIVNCRLKLTLPKLFSKVRKQMKLGLNHYVPNAQRRD